MADRPFVGAEGTYNYGGSRLDLYCDRCGLLPAWCSCPPLTEAECDAVLASAGIDAAAEFKRAQELLDAPASTPDTPPCTRCGAVSTDAHGLCVACAKATTAASVEVVANGVPIDNVESVTAPPAEPSAATFGPIQGTMEVHPRYGALFPRDKRP